MGGAKETHSQEEEKKHEVCDCVYMCFSIGNGKIAMLKFSVSVLRMRGYIEKKAVIIMYLDTSMCIFCCMTLHVYM